MVTSEDWPSSEKDMPFELVAIAAEVRTDRSHLPDYDIGLQFLQSQHRHDMYTPWNDKVPPHHPGITVSQHHSSRNLDSYRYIVREPFSANFQC